MKKEDIKDNVDEMIIQVARYIKACDLSEDEDTEIKLECALSLLVSAIDFTDNPSKNIKYIAEQQANIFTTFMMASTEVVKDIITVIYRLKGRKYDSSTNIKSHTFR